MISRLVPLWISVVSLSLVVGCRTDTSSPSGLPDTAGAMTSAPLTVRSVSKLTNPGPECPGARTPGFFCQNQDGKNPNLPLPEFLDLAAEGATILQSLDALASTNVANMVCFKGNGAPEDQLLRNLSALALNFAANLIDETTPLSDGTFPTVGDALAAAIAVANDPDATKQERNAVEGVLDDINHNVNTVRGDECVGDDEGGEREG